MTRWAMPTMISRFFISAGAMVDPVLYTDLGAVTFPRRCVAAGSASALFSSSASSPSAESLSELPSSTIFRRVSSMASTKERIIKVSLMRTAYFHISSYAPHPSQSARALPRSPSSLTTAAVHLESNS